MPDVVQSIIDEEEDEKANSNVQEALGGGHRVIRPGDKGVGGGLLDEEAIEPYCEEPIEVDEEDLEFCERTIGGAGGNPFREQLAEDFRGYHVEDVEEGESGEGEDQDVRVGPGVEGGRLEEGK